MMNAVEPVPSRTPWPVHDVLVINEIIDMSMVPSNATPISPVALILAPATDDERIPRVEMAMDEVLRM